MTFILKCSYVVGLSEVCLCKLREVSIKLAQVTRGIKKSGIYIIYIGSRRAISNDIATSTSVIFRPRQKNSLGQGRALGPSALGHGPALGNFSASDEK